MKKTKALKRSKDWAGADEVEPFTVTLTSMEMLMACLVGVRRNIESIEQKLHANHGFMGNAWEIHIEGACAEMAVAKVLENYWGGPVNTFKDADIGQKIQVRSTQYKTGCLIVRKDDSSDDIYYLVTGIAPTYIIRGWLYGRDARKKKWLQAPAGRPPAWFVPQDALRHPGVKPT